MTNLTATKGFRWLIVSLAAAGYAFLCFSAPWFADTRELSAGVETLVRAAPWVFLGAVFLPLIVRCSGRCA